MTTTKNNEHKKLNVPNKQEQNQTCWDSAEREGLRPKGNVPTLRFPEFQEEWDKCELGEFATIIGGYAFKSETLNSIGGKYQVVKMGNLYQNQLDLHRSPSYTDTLTRKAENVILRKDDIAITLTGTNNKRDFGYTYIFNDEKNLLLNQRCGLIRAKGNPYFLSCLLKTHTFLNQFFESATGGTGNQANVSTKAMEMFSVNTPSLKEQEKIGQLMALLDERIATQNKIIEDLKKLKSAISKKLLCNDKWTTYKIQDIAEIGRGRVISSVEIDRQKHPLYPVYSSQTSNDGIMGYLDNYMFDGEYITWTTDGANAGTVFYRKGKFNCTNVCGTLKIQPKFDCYFVSLVLQQATQKYVSSNLANPKLMNNTMASIKIRMPNIETQKQLSKVFQALDGCLLIHQRTCEMYLKEKQYLLRQMFI